MSERKFCDRCDVSLDLHGLIDDDEEPTEDDCRHANATVDLLSRYYS